MRLAGRMIRSGRYWAVEVAILDITTQGRSRREAIVMIADAVETLVDRHDFTVTVHLGEGDYFEISASDEGALTALLLGRERMRGR